jgi:pimeloyl-ACP methyl ester carboxylesterase
MIFSKSNLFFKFTRDIAVTNVLYSFPYALKWFYLRHIRRQISSSFLGKASDGTDCYLYSHLAKDFEPQDNLGTSAILFLHGKYASPLSLLHLAEIAQETSLPVFSLHVSYDGKHPKIHRNLLTLAIEEIERQIQAKGGHLKGLVLVGHSLGATEGAYRAFVDKDERIKAVISIAGRLRVVAAEGQNCPDFLISTVESVYQGIQNTPEIPLYQIIAREDWNAPTEATLVRLDEGSFHIVEKALHFNVIYYQETRNKFREYLKKAIS